MCKLRLVILSVFYMSTFSLADNSLSEPSAWFSIPVVGITQIQTYPDGLTAQYKGTIAYKNEIKWDTLSFHLTCRPAGKNKDIVLIQFNKERRDSSIDDHHLHNMDKHNRGYGLLVHDDGTVSIVKTSEPQQADVLLKTNERFDFSHPKMISLSQEKDGNSLTILLQIQGSSQQYKITDTLQDGYSDTGFIGMTIYRGRTCVELSNLTYSGEEIITNLNQTPRPVYMTDYFDESNRKLIHWRYDDWTTDVDSVLIESKKGILKKQILLDTVQYPQDYWILPADFKAKSIHLRVRNIDGNLSKPVEVTLKDDHAQYYTKEPQQRITTKLGKKYARFYYKESNDPFPIKGMNYVRLRYGDHCNFEAATLNTPAAYDPYDAETAFKIMKRTGFNTARVFITGRTPDNPGISGFYKNKGVYGPYMDNFIDFVKRAKKYGIYVFPTLCDGEIPLNEYYWKYLEGVQEGLTVEDVSQKQNNVVFYTRQGNQCRAQYVYDFLSYIKHQDPSLLKSLLALQCQNELSVLGDLWPFTVTEGLVEGPDGKQYDMSNDQQRRNLYINGLHSYHRAMVKAVKSVDPDLLVGEGMFVPRIVGKDYQNQHKGIRYTANDWDHRFPPSAAMVLDGPLDFVDIHIYYVNDQAALQESYKLDMISTELYTEKMQLLLKEKPFFMGEFGSFKFMDDTFEKAVQSILTTRDLAIKDNASGYMLWTFDTYEQRSIWHAIEGDENFLKKLSDAKIKF